MTGISGKDREEVIVVRVQVAKRESTAVRALKRPRSTFTIQLRVLAALAGGSHKYCSCIETHSSSFSIMYR